MVILSSSFFANIALTAAIAIIVIGTFVFEHFYLKKNDDELKRHQVPS